MRVCRDADADIGEAGEEEPQAWVELRQAEDECMRAHAEVEHDQWLVAGAHRRRREARDKCLSVTGRLEALKTLTPATKGVE